MPSKGNLRETDGGEPCLQTSRKAPATLIITSPEVLGSVVVSRAGFPAGHPPSSGALMIRLLECSAGQALSSSPSDKEDVAFHLHIYRTLFRF